MKKNLMFFVGVLATTTWLGCSHTSTKKESTEQAYTDSGSVRKLAGLMDAGIVGPNGEVILFYKNGNKIVIQRCEDYTVLNSRADCKTRPGTSVAQVPINEFKSRLKAALSVPGEYTAAMKKKIDLYKKGKQDDITELERQRTEAARAIQQIQDFITAYGQENADVAKMESLKQRLSVIEGKLADNSELAGAIREINQTIDQLVDQIIGNPTLQKFVFSKDKQSFEFNILRSYIKTPGISAQFASVRAGTFQMGSPSSEKGRYDDEVVHSVTLTKDFEIQQTEVTQAHWFLVMGYNPSRFKTKENCPEDYLEINGAALCPNHPVETVSWNDAQDFIKKINEGNDGYAYRLPTEAEWEYAARGGAQTAYSFGDDTGYLRDYGWYSENSGSQARAVGSKKANQYDLYDMHGNVWEWVQDWYASYPSGSQRYPVGAASGSNRVLRGGGWGNNAQNLRSAYRNFWRPGIRNSNIGFRLVRTAK